MIAKIIEKVKQYQRGIWQTLCLLLVAWAAYNLGQIYANGGPATQLKASAAKATAQQAKTIAPKPTPDKSDPRVLASKSSKSKKYHHPWCGSAKNIKEANRVWFASAAAAQAAGYTLAGNCKP